MSILSLFRICYNPYVLYNRKFRYLDKSISVQWTASVQIYTILIQTVTPTVRLKYEQKKLVQLSCIPKLNRLIITEFPSRYLLWSVQKLTQIFNFLTCSIKYRLSIYQVVKKPFFKQPSCNSPYSAGCLCSPFLKSCLISCPVSRFMCSISVNSRRQNSAIS